MDQKVEIRAIIMCKEKSETFQEPQKKRILFKEILGRIFIPIV